MKNEAKNSRDRSERGQRAANPSGPDRDSAHLAPMLGGWQMGPAKGTDAEPGPPSIADALLRAHLIARGLLRPGTRSDVTRYLGSLGPATLSAELRWRHELTPWESPWPEPRRPASRRRSQWQ